MRQFKMRDRLPVDDSSGNAPGHTTATFPVSLTALQLTLPDIGHVISLFRHGAERDWPACLSPGRPPEQEALPQRRPLLVPRRVHERVAGLG